MDKEADPARAVLERLDTQETLCGSEPPRGPDDDCIWGDCWCTLPADHPEEECVCEICRDRYGTPAWPVAR